MAGNDPLDAERKRLRAQIRGEAAQMKGEVEYLRAIPSKIGDVASGVVNEPMKTLGGVVDPRPVVRRYPWESIGVALFAGAALGLLASGRKTSMPAGAPDRSAGTIERFVTSLRDAVGRELEGLGNVLVKEASSRLRNFVQTVEEGGARQGEWQGFDPRNPPNGAAYQ